MKPTQYIAQLSEPRFLVCKQCKFAIWSRTVNNHFMDKYHKFIKFIRKIIITQIEAWDQLIQYSSEFEIFDSVDSSYDLLTIFTNELLCVYDFNNCHYICRSEKGMQEHLRKEHKVTRYDRKDRLNIKQQTRHRGLTNSWKKINCQRFFLSDDKSSFFEIKSSNSSRSDIADRIVSIWDQIIQQLNQKQTIVNSRMMKFITKDDARKINSLIERVKWRKYLAEYSREELLKSMKSLTQKDESKLYRIWQIMNDMIVLSQETMKKRIDIFIKIEMMRIEKDEQQYKLLRKYMREKRI